MQERNKKNICIIGSGFAGLSAATHLVEEGNNVYILEKNSTNGGRARKFNSKGFTFDMGPSWYWMPDVIETYFKTFEKKVDNYFDLVRIDPSYKIFLSHSCMATNTWIYFRACVIVCFYAPRVIVQHICKKL